MSSNIIQFYKKAPYPKASYPVFRQRAVVLGRPLEKAILYWSQRVKPQARDENWRTCSRCWEYKTWEFYWTDNHSKTHYKSMCKKCFSKYNSEQHKKYVEKVANWEYIPPAKKEYKLDKPIQWDETCCKAVLDVICKIWLLPPKKEEWEIEE